MRVALDVTALLGNPTGVGVMARELLRGLAQRHEVEVMAFVLSWRGRRALASALPPQVREVHLPMAARPLRSAWARFDHPAIELWTGTVDVVHGPNYIVPPARRAAQVATIHDLTFVRYPELCTADTLAYPPLIRRAIARGAWLHTVSNFVRDEVIEEFGAPAERVVTVANGALPGPIGGDPSSGRIVAGCENYILAIGTIEPRKDFPTLVRAFEALLGDRDGDRPALVIAGPDGWGADALHTAIEETPAEVRRRIRRLGWVDDDQRADLLAGARVLAYPSLYEGFGLVPLEAMSAGIPVVTTSVGALPETVGDAALLVPARDPGALADAMQRVLDDEDVAAELRERGRRRVAHFSWENTTDAMIELYRRSSGR